MKIALNRSDGGVTITTVISGNEDDIPEIIRKWEEANASRGRTVVSWQEVQDADIPTDKTNRDAWTWE